MKNCRLICGDCREEIKKLASNSVDIIVTDPPYNVGYKYNAYRDNVSEDIYIENLRTFQHRPAVFIHYPEEMIRLVCPALGQPEKLVAWIYNSNLPRQFRLIAWFNCKPDFSKAKQPYKNPTDKRVKQLMAEGSQGARLYDWWSVQQIKNVSDEKTAHPCQIPVAIIERIILLTTNEGDTVLDPYAGSGTTGVACARTKRKFIGIEIDKKYFEIAEKRIAAVQPKLF